MERFASGVDDEAREKEAKKILESEMDITDYQVEPEMEQVMTVFYVKPHPDPYEIQADETPTLPL